MTLSSNPNVLFCGLTDRAAVGIFVVQHGVFRYENAQFASLIDTEADQPGLLDLVVAEDRLATPQSFS